MNKKLGSSSEIDRVLASVKKKHLLIEEEVKGLLTRKTEEIVIPISIFNEKLGMLESASMYLKDELKLSFKEIAKLLKRDYKTIWTSYSQAKKKTKNEK
ncbi:MAG: hypothetical protein KKC75_04055 [Nanoarchaeota archaeon]|nr:hypothetical protein [Nanoarchaeota archaeon]MBU1005297.1 hypothetical protein [Nanoarchaeota archaeon]MBU1946364.1 hypothetical protein [Nanoarchaeota archaeon]